MSISVGQRIPEATLHEMTDDGPAAVTSGDLFKGRKVVLFAVPGAFTPTCSAKHVPSYLEHAQAIRGKGVDDIVCLSVNDPFVMGAWAKDQQCMPAVRMLADGDGAFTKALGMELDLSGKGLGVRSHRYSMVVDDGTVTHLHLEENPGEMKESSGERILADL